MGEWRLVLARHAKAARPYGVPDRERPLTGRGRRDARATGAWLRGAGLRPGLVACSDALRCRQTWELVAGVLPQPAVERIEPRLYGASTGDVLDIARAAAGTARTVMVVGHEPTMSVVTLVLAGRRSDASALEAVRERFRTAAVAVLRLPGGPSDLRPGGAVLEAYAVPRA